MAIDVEIAIGAPVVAPIQMVSKRIRWSSGLAAKAVQGYTRLDIFAS